jgi:CHAD domain-containing protein
MNLGSLPLNGLPGAARRPQRHEKWQRQCESWRQLLGECGRKPSRRRVHTLRVATLRLQAELEYCLEQPRTPAPAGRAMKRWNKQGDKLRRALQPVREADVYLAKLAGLRVSLAAPEEIQTRCSRRCLGQMEKLERRLQRVRQAAAKKLMAEIEDRRERLIRLSHDMEAALELQMPLRSGAGAVAGLIASLAVEFPEFGADRLHEFRKRVKKVRYLAELSAGADPQAARQAVALRQMQVAIGEWHDWQVLAQKAGRALRGRGKGNSLAELLETLTAESLQKALSLCRRLTARLVRQGQGNTASSPAPQKLPVRRVEPIVAAAERDCA